MFKNFQLVNMHLQRLEIVNSNMFAPASVIYHFDWQVEIIIKSWVVALFIEVDFPYSYLDHRKQTFEKFRCNVLHTIL